MTDSDRPHDSLPPSHPVNGATTHVVFTSSRPPAAADASFAEQVRALVACAHPDECLSRAVLLDVEGATETRTPFEWCGACGSIRVAGAAAVSPGLVATLQPGVIAEWTAQVELLGRAVAEVARAATALGSDVAQRAQILQSATAELDRAARAALAEFAPALERGALVPGAQ